MHLKIAIGTKNITKQTFTMAEQGFDIQRIKTTRETRGMHWPFKGILLAEPKGSL